MMQQTMNLLFMTFSSKKFISNPIDIVHFFSSLERIHEDMQVFSNVL